MTKRSNRKILESILDLVSDFTEDDQDEDEEDEQIYVCVPLLIPAEMEGNNTIVLKVSEIGDLKKDVRDMLKEWKKGNAEIFLVDEDDEEKRIEPTSKGRVIVR